MRAGSEKTNIKYDCNNKTLEILVSNFVIKLIKLSLYKVSHRTKRL